MRKVHMCEYKENKKTQQNQSTKTLVNGEKPVRAEEMMRPGNEPTRPTRGLPSGCWVSPADGSSLSALFQ